MAKYTTLLRSICESLSGLTESVGNDDTNEVIETARPLIFSFDYPVIDGVTPKADLETKILRHYYFREIGLETYGQWKFHLENRMNEIMPYYNQLYQSAVDMAELNPFEDVDYTKTIAHSGEDSIVNGGTDREGGTTEFDGTIDDSGHDISTRTYQSLQVQNQPRSGKISKYSDTPQGSISNLENDTYLTSAEIVTGTGTDTETTSGGYEDDLEHGKSQTIDNTTTHGKTFTHGKTERDIYASQILETVKGKMGTAQYAEILEKLRKTFLNIDLMIINDLSDLFMNVY